MQGIPQFRKVYYYGFHLRSFFVEEFVLVEYFTTVFVQTERIFMKEIVSHLVMLNSSNSIINLIMINVLQTWHSVRIPDEIHTERKRNARGNKRRFLVLLTIMAQMDLSS